MVRSAADQIPVPGPPGAPAGARPQPGGTADVRDAGRRDVGVVVVAAVVVAAAVARPLLAGLLDHAAVANWATIFVAITVQAMPFLALGVAVSAAVAAYVPPGALPRLLPRRPALAVPTAAAAGIALPGCECGSVPIAGRLVDQGVAAPAALAFLLAAPAINPVVLVATAVAFPHQPEVVLARFLASLAAAVAVGLLWARRRPGGRGDVERRGPAPAAEGGSRATVLLATAQHDLLHAGGFLIVGAATAATLQTVVPRAALDAVAGAGPLSVVALAVLAVVMAICSEADAFIAASLTQFSLTGRLAFMVVGPMVDVKLIALQAGTFGRRFAVRFAPLTLGVAIVSSMAVGWWLL
jgi:uncharacterized protein